MKLVIDANIVISILIKNGTNRQIFFSGKHSFYAPLALMDEVRRNIIGIQKKSGMEYTELSMLLETIMQKVIFIETKKYSALIRRALIISPDYKDFPYFALAMHLKCALWSNEKKLKKQGTVKVYNTEELILILD